MGITMKKIIIADDIKSIFDGQGTLLNRSGLRLIVSSSNAEALSLHQKEKADLIIAHLNSRDMDAGELCDRIRNTHDLRNVSLIIVHSHDADRSKALGCRANALIEITSNPSLLLEKTHQLLHVPKREDFRSPISVNLKGEHRSRAFLGFAENLSITGMLFDAEKILFKGDQISCAFFLPDDTHVKAEAEIVRTVDKAVMHDIYQYGIRFTDMDKALRKAIDAFVNRIRRLR